MKFTLGSNELDFTRGATRPTLHPIEPVQVIDRTASMELQVENLGPMIKTRKLDFYMMPAVDYYALLNWFVAVAGGAANSFTFEDELGTTMEVRIVSDKFEFSEVTPDAFTGSLVLEQV